METRGTTPYKSPSNSRLLAALEDRFLGADDSSWTGRKPLFTRIVADVPIALYINFLADKSYAASLAPKYFRPIDLRNDERSTLFTVLFFALEGARPLAAPPALGVLAPAVMQSNWRFYGRLAPPGMDPRPGVLFIRTVVSSLLMAAFGRRFARCFPLRRAQRMSLMVDGRFVTAAIDPGAGSAPALAFRAERNDSPAVGDVFDKQFISYDRYARWIVDQHSSLAVWPREYVLQDMHLDVRMAEILPLRALSCSVAGLEAFVSDPSNVYDCFVVKGLKVYLDNILVSPGGVS
jgi:hypothetical protein